MTYFDYDRIEIDTNTKSTFVFKVGDQKITLTKNDILKMLFGQTEEAFIITKDHVKNLRKFNESD